MTYSLEPRPPATRTVLVAEFKLLAITLRRPVAFGAGALLLAGLAMAVTGASFDFSPALGRAVAIVGLLTPFAIWKDEGLFSRGTFFDRPLDRPIQIAVKAAAGLGWFLAATLAFALACLALAAITGGRFDPPLAPFGIQRALTAVAGPRPWAMFPLFSAALVSYLGGTALAVGVRHPLRWGFAALALLGAAWIVAGEGGDARRALGFLIGPLGLDAVMTGGWTPASDPATAMIPGALPAWFGASLLWSAGALGLAALAAGRHRERR